MFKEKNNQSELYKRRWQNLLILLIVALIFVPVTYSKYTEKISETLTLSIRKPNYKVEFYSNRGDGNPDEVVSQDFVYGTAQDLTLNTFTKNGYIFNKWTTNSDGTGTSYQNGQNVNNLSNIDGAVIKLYANYLEDINYSYPGDYEFTGSNYINTGISLFSEENINRNFEVSFEIKQRNTSTKQATILSAMDETGIPWPGIVYRILDGTSEELGANVTEQIKSQKSYKRANIQKVSIKRVNGILYVNINDTVDTQFLDMTTLTTPFDSPLVFGASLNRHGNPQRYFKGTLSNMDIKFFGSFGKITFDANGGTGTMGIQIVYQDTCTIAPNSFVRPDYEFAGWNTMPDGSGTAYATGDTVTGLATQGATLNLYAQWRKYEYSVNFEPNGGTGEMPIQVFQSGIAQNLSHNAFTKPGSTFLGWNTMPNGLGTAYDDEESVNNLGTNGGDVINLYAMWGTEYSFADTTFNGTNYIDTGISLFDEANKNKNFEISFTIGEYTSNGNQATLISAMDETASPWPGFVFRVVGNRQFELGANVDNSIKNAPRYTINPPADIKINRVDGVLYISINGGNPIQILDMNSLTKVFDAHLSIGASLDGTGNPQRYFVGSVSNINVNVYD
ncbi:MAG: InlB B-repeat-containing protein [Clostridia bacterium]|nr:InlB B-repeat-containing protein [Clostridia bacterium]